MSKCIPKCEVCGADIPSPPDALMGWDGRRPIYLCLEHQKLYNGAGFSICVRCRRRVSNNLAHFEDEGAYCTKCWRERNHAKQSLHAAHA